LTRRAAGQDHDRKTPSSRNQEPVQLSETLKMALLLSLFLLLLQCLFSTTAAKKPTDFKVVETKIRCPFDMTFQFNKELTAVEVEYSGKSSALARIGDGASNEDSRHECWVSTLFSYPPANTSFIIPSAVVDSTVSLGEGVVAKVETSLFGNSDARLVSATRPLQKHFHIHVAQSYIFLLHHF
jgi:hypothetical protein